MKKILYLVVVFAMFSCSQHGEKTINNENENKQDTIETIVTEKFITSDRDGYPTFYIVTDENVYSVRKHVYATYKIGQRIYVY